MERAAKNIYRIKMPPGLTIGFEPSNVYICGNNEIAIIDAGYPEETSISAILEAWNELGKPDVKGILITHAHIDHAGSLETLKKETGAPVYIHKNEIQRLGTMFSMEQYDIIIEEGDIINAGNFRIKALHMPGHTAGHVCFLEETSGALFTGDLILGNDFAVVVPPDGDMSDYMKSLERTRELKPEIILPGHGAPVLNPDEWVEEYICHRNKRNQQILECLKPGEMSIPDMAEIIYADLVPGLRLTGRLQIYAHLSKLKKDGMVEYVSGDGTDGVYRLS